jgi:tRNA(adenine34) deaminase
MNDEYYMQMAINEAKKCEEYCDVPVGAVIVMNDEVVAKAYNTREKDQQGIGHAEINALTIANKRVNRYRLDGAIIYITKEPCLMCMGALLSARISRIVYGAKDLRFGTEQMATDNNFNHKCEVVGGVMREECESMLTDFFKKLRGKNENSRKN